MSVESIFKTQVDRLANFYLILELSLLLNIQKALEMLPIATSLLVRAACHQRVQNKLTDFILGLLCPSVRDHYGN